ncbi:outer membrane beta-barrel protein [Flagellimonas sp. W118]|uniref:outer membrane beta-barrel protein n=1 Tax=Flagellimonas sp. W118 TaxID=3410791 RepID=UPI003BF59F01
MMGKKNLEQLFKEVFKDFKESPDDNVWKSIEASLDKKEKKKRVIPIWWRLGGVAALLALLFYVVNPFESSNENNDIIITETQQETDSSNINSNTEDSKKSEIFTTPDAEQFVDSSNENELEPVEQSNSEKDADDALIKNQSLRPKQQLAGNPNQPYEDIGQEKNSVSSKKLNSFDTTEQEIVSSDIKQQPKLQTENEALEVAETDISLKNLETEHPDKLPSENTSKEVDLPQKESLFEISKSDDAIAENNADEQENKVEEISKDEDLDSTPEKKSIFEVIKEQEEEAIAENTSQKWSVGPSVAPVYFSATGNGSPIHSNFAANSKSGNVNLSYGLTVAYELGKKLKVRSGVHRVNYGYDTNDVIFSSSLSASPNDLIENIDYSQASRTVIVQSKEKAPQFAANDAFVELAANETPSLDGKMVQRLGYIEVPLELDYSIIDKKFGVNLIGGVSSLFLVDNSVLLESNDLVTEVGEANNANSVNFSTNVGVGLNYEFSSKIQLSLEPVLKYQLNTFSETAGSFRPFSVGVYSGVRFNF